MQPLTRSHFAALIGALDGQVIHTLSRGRAFRISVLPDGISITPSSSGKERRVPWQRIERVLARFNESGSYTPADFHDLTFDSSYILAALNRVLSA